MKKLTIKDILGSKNVAEFLDEETLNTIGSDVYGWWESDKRSREGWEKSMEDANKLAMQVKEEKNFPWPKASNVKFPLLTIAAVRFNAMAYPALIQSNEVVKCRAIGEDPSGEKLKRADRVSKHMSYQVMEQDEGWEEAHDRCLIVAPIMGCAFKKTYFDPIKGHNCSELVMPFDLVVDYYAKSLEEAERKTHQISMSHRRIKERQNFGIFLDIELPKPTESEESKKDGFTPPVNTDNAPRELLECHCYWDLDEDDYPEPYVITVDRSTKKVLRIFPRFTEFDLKRDVDEALVLLEEQRVEVTASQAIPPDSKAVLLEDIDRQAEELEKSAKIISILAREYFTKYPLIPAPDGGFYDLGFGVLLGPTNESVNTLINQLIDSGTLSNSNNGFIGRGAKLRGGKMSFEPFEWKKVEAYGDDLRKSLVPLPVNQPSPVLLNLLQLLINYGERLSSTTDAMVGEMPGQNTPATLGLAVMDQGMKTLHGVFKRMYRAMKSEFRKIYLLNRDYLNEKEYFAVLDSDESLEILQQDYMGDPRDIRPAADPNVFSKEQKIAQAQFLATRSASVSGYNTYNVEKRLLDYMDVPAVEEIYPDPSGPNAIPPAPNPEIELRKAEEERKTAEVQSRTENDKARVLIEAAVAEAEISKKEAGAILDLAKARSAGNEIEIKRMEALLGVIKERREGIGQILDAMKEETSEKSRTARVERAPANSGSV